jgi:hypothetical protein
VADKKTFRPRITVVVEGGQSAVGGERALAVQHIAEVSAMPAFTSGRWSRWVCNWICSVIMLSSSAVSCTRILLEAQAPHLVSERSSVPQRELELKLGKLPESSDEPTFN